MRYDTTEILKTELNRAVGISIDLSPFEYGMTMMNLNMHFFKLSE